MKITNTEHLSYLSPKVTVIAVNARHSILISSGNERNEQMDGNPSGYGDNFWD